MDSKKFFREGQSLLMAGRYRESIESFTKSVESGDAGEVTYLSRGVAFVKDGQADRAIEDFSKTISLNNINYRAFYFRGIAYMIKESYQSAVTDFTVAIDLHPDYGVAYFARGTAYAQLGEEDEAAKNIKKAITYMESNVQGFADSYGILRNQFDRALSIMTGEGTSPEMTLSEEEAATIKKWIDA